MPPPRPVPLPRAFSMTRFRSKPPFRVAPIWTSAPLALMTAAAVIATPVCPLRAQTLQEFSPVKPGQSPQVVIFADGSVKDVVGQPGDATSTTGSLGVTF